MTVRHAGTVPEIEPTVVRLLDHIASEWAVQADRHTSNLRFVMRATGPDDDDTTDR